MMNRIIYGYKITKPRPFSFNLNNLNEFKREVHQARRRLHMQAVAYQNKIEDDFLAQHKKDMEKQHFENQCKFRSTISRNAYALYQQTQKKKAMHEQYLNRLQKYVHTQEVKKMNRNRIKKILEFESQNYWLQGQNINEKFITESVFPEYLGSTEYYHKMHSQSLAYENLDFDLLHKLSSTQETIKQKNRMLIPIYHQFIKFVRIVKFTELDHLTRKHQLTIGQLKKNYADNTQELQAQIKKQEEIYEIQGKALKDKYTDKNHQRTLIFEKIRDLVGMIKKWKQYTDILSLTSAQILKIINEQNLQNSINAEKKTVKQKNTEKKQQAFVDPMQQDTQDDDQITLEEYLLKKDNKKNQQIVGDQNFNQELESLLKVHDSSDQFDFEEMEDHDDEINLKSEEEEVNLTKNVSEAIAQPKKIEVDEGYLTISETTSSIQTLKEDYKDDEEMVRLLNTAGEIVVEYPKLFKTIWDKQIL